MNSLYMKYHFRKKVIFIWAQFDGVVDNHFHMNSSYFFHHNYLKIVTKKLYPYLHTLFQKERKKKKKKKNTSLITSYLFPTELITFIFILLHTNRLFEYVPFRELYKILMYETELSSIPLNAWRLGGNQF